MATITLTAPQLRCLASPVRNEVFMQIRTMGQASVREIAKATGRKPEAVHYHVKSLVSAGLAREAFRRPAPKKPESVYEPIGKELRLPKPGQKPEVAALIRKSTAAGFRQTLRGYLKAARQAQTEPKIRPYLHIVRMNARLSPKDAREFLDRIEDAVKFADEHRDEEGMKLVWSSITYPVPAPS